MTSGITFYDAEMIAQIINTMLQSYHGQHIINNNKKHTIDNVTTSEVDYVMKQLKTTGTVSNILTSLNSQVLKDKRVLAKRYNSSQYCK
jgi:hypothetical protein